MQTGEAAVERSLWRHTLGCAPLGPPAPQVHHRALLDAHLTSGHFGEKSGEKPSSSVLHCPGEGKPGRPKSQQKHKLFPWELPRAQKPGIPEISEGFRTALASPITQGFEPSALYSDPCSNHRTCLNPCPLVPKSLETRTGVSRPVTGKVFSKYVE